MSVSEASAISRFAFSSLVSISLIYYLFIELIIKLLIYLSFIYLSVCLSVYLSICLSVMQHKSDKTSAHCN